MDNEYDGIINAIPACLAAPALTFFMVYEWPLSVCNAVHRAVHMYVFKHLTAVFIFILVLSIASYTKKKTVATCSN